MCGGSFVAYGRGHRGSSGRMIGFEVDELSSRGQIVAAVSVLVPVALSGVALAFTPVWWVFTTYFWIVFPAFGLLVRGLAGTFESGTRRIPVEAKERELLGALRERGEISPARAAMVTSLSVAEAEGMLRNLAGNGHLEVRARVGGIFYALWESEAREPEALPVNGKNGGAL